MFCEQCGKQNSDEALFCEHCGAPLQSGPAEPVVPAAKSADSAPAAPVATVPKVSLLDQAKNLCQKNKWILPAAVAVLAVVIIVLVVTSILGKQVNLSNYFNVELSGYNNYGRLTTDFDEESFVLRVLGEKEFKGYGDFNIDDYTTEQLEAYEKKYANQFEKAVDLAYSVRISEELPEGKTSRNLSNDDVIIYTFTYDEDLAKELGITLKSTTFEYTVKDLTEVSTYDLLQYFDISATGYDGYGSAEVVCNKTATMNVGGVTFETEAGSNYVNYTLEDGFSYGFGVYIDSVSNGTLSNGDVLTLVAGIEEDEFASDGVILVGSTKEVTVSGLEEVQSIDILQYFDLSYTGINGSGTAERDYQEPVVTVGDYEFYLSDGYCNYQDEYIGGFYFDLSNRSGLSNGDTITCTLSVDESYFARYGLVFSSLEKEFTVSGLAEYAGDITDLENLADGLVEAGAELVNNYLNDDWSRAVHNDWRSYSDQYIGDDLALYKMVLTTPKSTSNSTKNTLWLIYTVTLKDNSMEENTVYYFAVSQNNIAVYGSGEVYETTTSKSRYSGYTSYDELFTDLIDAYNLNIFESEISQNEE